MNIARLALAVIIFNACTKEREIGVNNVYFCMSFYKFQYEALLYTRTIYICLQMCAF